MIKKNYVSFDVMISGGGKILQNPENASQPIGSNHREVVIPLCQEDASVPGEQEV